MKVTGSMITFMAKAAMFVAMVIHFLVNGSWTSDMAREKKFGQMELFLKEILSLVKSKVGGLLNGIMVHNSMETLKTIKSPDKDYLSGKMAASIKALG